MHRAVKPEGLPVHYMRNGDFKTSRSIARTLTPIPAVVAPRPQLGKAQIREKRLAASSITPAATSGHTPTADGNQGGALAVPSLQLKDGEVTMNDIEKLDNVTWYGHCVIHVMAAISDLPDEAKLVFCQDLEKFIRRQERVLSKA
jgi:hypothetical protein